MQTTPLIDHINLPVSSITRSLNLYRTILAELGINVLVAEDEVIGFGRSHWEFGIEQVTGPINPIHIAFSTASNATVASFYQSALKGGGTDNGGPGFRKEYGPTYYTAYILDFDGHNIEVVCRKNRLAQRQETG